MNTFEVEKGHKMYCLEQRQHDYEMGFNLSNLSPIHVQLLICHDIGLKQCKFVVVHDDEGFEDVSAVHVRQYQVVQAVGDVQRLAEQLLTPGKVR